MVAPDTCFKAVPSGVPGSQFVGLSLGQQEGDIEDPGAP